MALLLLAAFDLPSDVDMRFESWLPTNIVKLMNLVLPHQIL